MTDNPIDEPKPDRTVTEEFTDPRPMEEPDTNPAPPVEAIPTEEKGKKTEKKTKRKFLGRKKAGPKKSLYQQAAEWLHGTPEHPVPPFSTKGKIHRWYMQQYKGYVQYITTHYDKQLDEYVYVKELVPRSSLPREAVHVTNQKNTYHLDIDLPRRGFSTAKDNGFTAVDAYLWMKCSKIDEAMAIKLDSPMQFDIKKYLPLLAIGFGLFCGVYYYIVMMH